jgi:hypothetical protein
MSWRLPYVADLTVVMVVGVVGCVGVGDARLGAGGGGGVSRPGGTGTSAAAAQLARYYSSQLGKRAVLRLLALLAQKYTY